MAQSVAFQTGNATALPCKPSSFDVVTMALVLFFLSDPVLGIAEMKRVVKSEGTLAAYVCDISGEGLPIGLIPKGLQRDPGSKRADFTIFGFRLRSLD